MSINSSNVTLTQSVSGSTVTQTLGGTATETTAVSATLNTTAVADDGSTFVLTGTVSNNHTKTLTPAASGAGTFKIQSATLSDGRAVTVAADGQSLSYPA